MTGRDDLYDDAGLAAIAAAIGHHAARGDRAFLNGLILDGTARRLGITASSLAPFMRLPPAEAERRVRTRMAELIANRVAAAGCITRDELLGGGFTDAEIGKHYHAALRASGVARMAA